MLERDGVDLFFGRGMSAYFGLTVSLLTLVLLYIYSKTNRFFVGFFAGFCAVVTTYIGGFLFLYVFLTGKSENKHRSGVFSLKNKWQEFIHDRSNES